MALALPFGTSGAPQGTSSLNLPFGTSGEPAGANNLAVNFAVDTIARPNSYIGLNSFVSVASHYVTIGNTNTADDSSSVSDCRELGVGQLVFARDRKGIKNSNPQPQYSVPLGNEKSRNTVELKELTQLNQYLKAHSERYAKASEIVSEWKLLGVIKTEAAPATGDYGRAAVSRIVNLITSHRVSVLNYWAKSRIIQTQNLYLIVNKNAMGHWQIVPWTSPNHAYPPISQIYNSMVRPNATSSTISAEQPGVVIYVGKSSDQTYEEQSTYKSGITNADVVNSLVKRGMMQSIEVYLGI